MSLAYFVSETTTDAKDLVGSAKEEIRATYSQAIEVMEPICKTHLKTLRSYDNQEPIIGNTIIDDIEKVASLWTWLFSLDNVPFPAEQAILHYRWLEVLCPDKASYREMVDDLEKRLRALKE